MRVSKNNFTGYVLAGGNSSRMKTDKAFLQIGGETFLTRAARTLAEVCAGKVKIVLNQNQTAPQNYECVRDIFTERGALGGIHAALCNCRSDWAIILAVDLPFVTSEAIENLQNIALASNEFSAIVPKQIDGRLQPLCAAYRVKDCLPKIEEFLRKESSNAVKDFFALLPTRFIEPNELTTDLAQNLFFNVNCPSDFQQLVSTHK